jgi:ABC-type enterobactin transport system permease subunit
VSAKWLDIIERTIRTAIQVSAAAVLALWMDAGSFNNIDWNTMWQVAIYASGLSFLMALAGTKTGDPNNGSLVSPPDA